MTIVQLKDQLLQLLNRGVDTPFADWCLEKAPGFDGFEYLDRALIVMSGYGDSEWPPLANHIRKMIDQELASGRWMNLPANEKGAAHEIAKRALKCFDSSDYDAKDPENVVSILGVYCFVAVYCSPWFDAASFKRLFALSWCDYFGC